MSGDADQEFISDGITEDIITELSRFSDLFVIARNSSFAYKGQSVDIRRIAGELGVRYVLEGSVRRGGKRLRITAQLLDSIDGGHVWGEKYDSDAEDVFDLQDEITRNVVGSIAPQIELAELERSRRLSDSGLTVYELALKAQAGAGQGEDRPEEPDLQHAPSGSVGTSRHGWLPMSFAGGVCLEFGFKERLSRESAVIIKILAKALHGQSKLAHFGSTPYC